MNRPGIYNSHMQYINWLAIVEGSRKKYVKKFNTLSKKEGSVKATAILFQLMEGIKKLIANNQDSLKGKLSIIIEFLEKETKNEESLPDLAKMLLYRTKKFHKADLFNTHLFATEEFKLSIQSYYETYNGMYWHVSDESFNSIVSLKKEINSYSVDVYVLNSIQKEIINKNYPEEIKDLTKEELEKELKTQGRPFDESAPQDKIRNHVVKLLSKAKNREEGYLKYWHFEGVHKDKPNKSQILKALKKEKLVGVLEDETIKDRIVKALKELGY